MRTLLITGPGGSGRTTVACSTALAEAARGRRVLLISADRSGAGAAAVGMPAGAAPGGPVAGEATQPADGTDRAGAAWAEPVAVSGGTVPLGAGTTALPVPAVPGLWAARVDPVVSFRADALDAQGRLGSVLDLLGAPPLDPEELTELPGADALALLRALRDAALAEAWDTVVVDLPPIHAALAVLALPEQLRRYLGRLVPAERQAARALRPVLAQLAGVPMPGEWAYQAAARADVELAAAQAVIEDAGTTVRLVVEPGAHAADTVRHARTGLVLYGHRLEAVVANRLLPTGSPDPWLADLSAQQHKELRALRAEFTGTGTAVHEVPHLGREPLGVDDLAQLAAEPPAPTGERPKPWTVEDRLAADGHFLWRLPLPGATRERLDLVRRGDELVVDTEGFRRILPLPSALRRCTVAGASLRDGALSVRFEPDPALWPR